MIKDIREDFWQNVKIIGTNEEINQSLEKAARVADFFELGELMAEDALQRNESCGGHFREESQTEENEAKRDDENFSHVAAWEYTAADKPEVLHKEQLQFEFVKPSQRSYK
jgi:succinate dehydrogenase / fumarate reductase, flavoprotein subunit